MTAPAQLRRTNDRGPHQLPGLVYWALLAALFVPALFFAPPDPLHTALWVGGAWALATVVTLPGRHRAGAGLVTVYTVALVLRNHPQLTLEGRVWALVAMGACASIFAIHPIRQFPLAPVPHLFALLQGVYLYVGWLVARPSIYNEDAFTPAVRAAGFRATAIFMAFVVAASTLAARFLTSRTRPEAADATSTQPPPLSRAYAAMGFTAATSIALEATGLSGSLGVMPDLVRTAFIGCGLIIVVRWIDGSLAIAHRVLIVGVFVLVAVGGLGTGALYQTAVPAIAVLGLYVARRRRIPLVALFVAGIIAIGLNVSKSEYRENVRSGLLSGSQAELGVSYLNQSAQTFSGNYGERFMVSAHRFSNSDLLGYMVTWVPERYPYYGMWPYRRLPVVLLPRVLYPEKGAFNYSNEIGREYELIGRSDYVTSVNTPVATEAYVTGGPLVLVVIGVLTGGVLVLLGWQLRHRRIADHVVTGLALVYAVSGAVESGFLSIFVAPFYTVALLLFIRWVTGEPRPGRSTGAQVVPRRDTQDRAP